MVWGRFRFTIIAHLALWLKRLGFRWIFNGDLKTQTRRGFCGRVVFCSGVFDSPAKMYSQLFPFNY